jgi:hypothetical protein
MRHFPHDQRAEKDRLPIPAIVCRFRLRYRHDDRKIARDSGVCVNRLSDTMLAGVPIYDRFPGLTIDDMLSSVGIGVASRSRPATMDCTFQSARRLATLETLQLWGGIGMHSTIVRLGTCRHRPRR